MEEWGGEEGRNRVVWVGNYGWEGFVDGNGVET